MNSNDLPNLSPLPYNPYRYSTDQQLSEFYTNGFLDFHRLIYFKRQKSVTFSDLSQIEIKDNHSFIYDKSTTQIKRQGMSIVMKQMGFSIYQKYPFDGKVRYLEKFVFLIGYKKDSQLFIRVVRIKKYDSQLNQDYKKYYLVHFYSLDELNINDIRDKKPIIEIQIQKEFQQDLLNLQQIRTKSEAVDIYEGQTSTISPLTTDEGFFEMFPQKKIKKDIQDQQQKEDQLYKEFQIDVIQEYQEDEQTQNQYQKLEDVYPQNHYQKLEEQQQIKQIIEIEVDSPVVIRSCISINSLCDENNDKDNNNNNIIINTNNQNIYNSNNANNKSINNNSISNNCQNINSNFEIEQCSKKYEKRISAFKQKIKELNKKLELQQLQLQETKHKKKLIKQQLQQERNEKLQLLKEKEDEESKKMNIKREENDNLQQQLQNEILINQQNNQFIETMSLMFQENLQRHRSRTNYPYSIFHQNQ